MLDDLIASSPGEEGKWFATAKDLGRLGLAIDLARRSPCDPTTLVRAARNFLKTNPAFAFDAARAALHWISLGHGYEVTPTDLLEAQELLTEAARMQGRGEQADALVQQLINSSGPAAKWMQSVLGGGIAS